MAVKYKYGFVEKSVILCHSDSGQIVGYGYINGNEHAFLMTPWASSVVPEPATMLLLGAGILGAFSRRRVC